MATPRAIATAAGITTIGADDARLPVRLPQFPKPGRIR
jgi:hypothetical protein